MSNTKFSKIIIDTPKGQYEIPLRLVAENRADYYAVEVDGYEKGSKEYEFKPILIGEGNVRVISLLCWFWGQVWFTPVRFGNPTSNQRKG